jgi:SAM-dependent methyltransferase
MSKTPTLTDRKALTRNRARCHPDAMFLHHAARDDVEDRLSLVNRSFTRTAVITGHPDQWRLSEDTDMIADDDLLALDEAQYDLLVHAMSLHWASDPVGQLIQMRRALRPDGLMLAVFPGGQTLHELRAVLGQAETDLSGGLSPRVLPMGDIRDLGGLLQRAGFALPVADNHVFNVEYDDAFALMRDLRRMGESSALDQRPRQMTRRDLFLRAAALYAEHFPGTRKPVRATFELITLTGWAPSASQPQPLRPGSATARLADALGASETKLP